EGGRHLERALYEGFPTLQLLKSEGLIGAVGAGIYFMDVWKRVLIDVDLDVILLHNHHTLADVRAFELLPLTEAKHVGVINAAPFSSGLLTGAEPPPWHPAPPAARELFARAARLASEHGSDLARLALGFSCQEPRLPVTIFSCADCDSLERNLRWAEEPVDRELVADIQALLEPVMNRQWHYGGTLPAGSGGPEQADGVIGGRATDQADGLVQGRATHRADDRTDDLAKTGASDAAANRALDT